MTERTLSLAHIRCCPDKRPTTRHVNYVLIPQWHDSTCDASQFEVHAMLNNQNVYPIKFIEIEEKQNGTMRQNNQHA